MSSINPYFLLQIYLILTFCLGCLIPLKKTSLIVLAGIFHLNLLVLFFGKSKSLLCSSPSVFSLYAILSLCLMLTAVYLFRNIKEKRTVFFKEKLDRAKNEYTLLVKKNKEIQEKITALENEAMEIGSIYESIKDMNISLDLNNSLEVFAKAFSKLIQFKKAEIILLNNEEAKTGVKKIYAISEDFDKNDLPDIPIREKHLLIVQEMQKRKNNFYTKNINLKEEIVEDLEEKGKFIAFTAVPLFAEKEIVAILTVSDLKKEHLKKILLLTTQFALEIKKAYLYERVQELSWFDGLTGLYLNRYFSKLVEDEFKRAIKSNEPLTFLMLDTDSFKKYNDKYGHLVGDIILKNIANIIKNNAREFDIVGRYGGDEFIIVLSSADKKQAFYIAQRIKNEVEEYRLNIENIHEKIKVSVSIGISSYPEDGNDAKMLIDKADFALYRSKKIGKNVVTLFGKET